jgi:predicted dehydrogenase
VVLNPAEPVRALVIGTGSIGRRHIESVRTLQQGSKLALLRRRGAEDEYSRRIGADVHASVDEALAWQPDVAIVATPSNCHIDVLPSLLRAGVPTLIEKPVVVDERDVRALEKMEPSSLPPTQVGCVLRFLPAVERLREWIVGGRLGALIRARLDCGQYLADWRRTDYRTSYSAEAERGGGVIFDLVHEIDLAVMLFGDCQLKHALAARRSSLEINCEDVALLHLSADGGLPISINLDYVSRAPVRNIEVVGELASARLDLVARRMTLTGAHETVEEVIEGFDLMAAYRLELTELLDAAAGIAQTRLPLHEGLRATRLAIAAHDAVHPLRPVGE